MEKVGYFRIGIPPILMMIFNAYNISTSSHETSMLLETMIEKSKLLLYDYTGNPDISEIIGQMRLSFPNNDLLYSDIIVNIESIMRYYLEQLIATNLIECFFYVIRSDNDYVVLEAHRSNFLNVKA